MTATVEKSGVTHFRNPDAGSQNVYTREMREIVSVDSSVVARSDISQWPGYSETPLLQLEGFAGLTHVRAVYYKDESDRFGLKSFKALGGSYAVARQLVKAIEHATGNVVDIGDLVGGNYSELAQKITVATATDGNHGRSVAWGARMFGCACVVYIHADVSAGREQMIAEQGADVVRISGNYDDSVKEVAEAAEDNGWIVVSDNSYEGYVDIPKDVALGYTVMLSEIVDDLDGEVPTHIFIQGGCGGLASTVCGFFWDLWAEKRPRLVVVEPEQANCLQLSAIAQRRVTVGGKLDTYMAGLACGEVSLIAWDVLSTGADDFATLPERYVPASMQLLARGLPPDSPIEAGESAVAGVGLLLASADDPDLRDHLGLSEDSCVLLIGTEGATDPELYSKLTSPNDR